MRTLDRPRSSLIETTNMSQSNDPVNTPPPPSENIQGQNENKGQRPSIPWWLYIAIAFTFIWIFIGVSVIIGLRMYWNSPIHPSFALFGAVAFSSVTAFAIVISLDIATGRDLSFEFANLKFTGTSGPVTLWILVFLAIMGTFILGNFQELVKSDATPNPALHHLATPSNSSTSGASK
jgi:hypothetical protein